MKVEMNFACMAYKTLETDLLPPFVSFFRITHFDFRFHGPFFNIWCPLGFKYAPGTERDTPRSAPLATCECTFKGKYINFRSF